MTRGFAVENILHAAKLGAVCVNYCELSGFVSSGEKIVSASVQDRIGHEKTEVRAKCFHQCGGAWGGSSCQVSRVRGGILI